MRIVEFCTKSWWRVAATCIVCFVASMLSMFVIATIYEISTIDEQMDRLAAENGINTNSGEINQSEEKDIAGEVTTVLKVGGATFFVAVKRNIKDLIDYEIIAKSICNKEGKYGLNACIVAMWDDESKMGRSLPMSKTQADDQIYAWSLGESLWNCRKFPQVGKDKCF